MVVPSTQQMSEEDIKPPLTGNLLVFVSEAKNIGVQGFRDFLSESPGRQATSDQLRVGFEFWAPQRLDNLFRSDFVNDTLLEDFQQNLKKTERFVEHPCVDNPSWRTPEQPAGKAMDLGRVIKLPKSNAYLRLTVYSVYRENGVDMTFEYGRAEYVCP